MEKPSSSRTPCGSHAAVVQGVFLFFYFLFFLFLVSQLPDRGREEEQRTEVTTGRKNEREATGKSSSKNNSLGKKDQQRRPPEGCKILAPSKLRSPDPHGIKYRRFPPRHRRWSWDYHFVVSTFKVIVSASCQKLTPTWTAFNSGRRRNLQDVRIGEVDQANKYEPKGGEQYQGQWQDARASRSSQSRMEPNSCESLFVDPYTGKSILSTEIPSYSVFSVFF